MNVDNVRKRTSASVVDMTLIHPKVAWSPVIVLFSRIEHEHIFNRNKEMTFLQKLFHLMKGKGLLSYINLCVRQQNTLALFNETILGQTLLLFPFIISHNLYRYTIHYTDEDSPWICMYKGNLCISFPFLYASLTFPSFIYHLFCFCLIIRIQFKVNSCESVFEA